MICSDGWLWERALEWFGGPQAGNVEDYRSLLCSVSGLLTKSLSCTPADFNCSHFVDSISECHCCKPVFHGLAVLLRPVDFIITFKRKWSVDCPSQRADTVPPGPGSDWKEWKDRWSQKELRPFDVWLVIELQVDVFDVFEPGWVWRVKQSNSERTPATL